MPENRRIFGVWSPPKEGHRRYSRTVSCPCRYRAVREHLRSGCRIRPGTRGAAERDILFRKRKQTFPFVAQFHALQGFQSAIHDRTPSHRQIPSHHAVPHRPIHRVRIGVATMIDILPAHGQPCRGDGYSCILVPDNPCPFGMYRRIQKVYMGSVDCSGGLVRVVTEQLPAADMQAVAPDFQVAGNPDTVLDGSYHTFRIGNVLRIGFRIRVFPMPASKP